jgi:tRNA(Ile)-lysidine synthase
MACSGGVDSMSSLHWLSKGGRMPYGIIHIHHNTGEYADKALKFVVENYQKYCFDLFVTKIKESPPSGFSKESWWREQRYRLIQELVDKTGKDYPTILAHNLDDCVEQYIMNTLIRMKRRDIINYNGPSNTIRPFRAWKKSEILSYAYKNKLEWIEDPSNRNTSFVRNKVRLELLPKILEINPGLYRFVKSLVIKEKHEEKKI